MKSLDKLKNILKARADLMLIASEPNIRYITGEHGIRGVIVIPKDAEPFMLTSALEKPRVKNGMEVLSVGKNGDIKKKSILLALKGEIERRNLKHRKIGIEKKLISAVLLERAMKFTKNTVDLTDEIMNVRSIKTPEEIRKIRTAAKIADMGIKAAKESLRPGITERELARQAEYSMRKRADWFSFLSVIGAGPNSAIPHHRVSDRKIKATDLVVVDIGAIYKGYCSDMTRTFCLKPGKREKKIHSLVLKAHGLSISKIRPGATGHTVDKAGRDFINKNSFKIPHGIGHGIGINVHEQPTISPESKHKLKPGMVFTIEPGIYIDNYGGVRIEDMILLTKKGKIVLTKSPRRL